MSDPLVSLAFLTGLLGSAHCLGMCGGLVTALALAGKRLQVGPWFHLFYHLGRISTYALIGAAVGWLGSAIVLTDAIRDMARIILVCSDLFIVLVGFGSLGIFPAFNLIDLDSRFSLRALGGGVQRLLRLPHSLIAFPLGLLLGLLPCGFVYAMALTAAQTTDIWYGSLIMLSFGAGTLPALLLFGGAAQWLTHTTRRWMLRGAGIVVISMGLYNLYRHLQQMGVL